MIGFLDKSTCQYVLRTMDMCNVTTILHIWADFEDIFQYAMLIIFVENCYKNKIYRSVLSLLHRAGTIETKFRESEHIRAKLYGKLHGHYQYLSFP